MALPRIPSPNGPVVVPAVAEQQYPDLFFTQLLFVAVPGCDQIQIWTRPYNYDTGTIKPESEESITNEPGLWQLAADYPLVATVMGGVIEACTLLLYLRKAQADLVPLQAAVDNYAATLAEKESALGIAQNALANVTANRDACQAALADANAAIVALPLDATDEDKVAIQQAADVAADALASSLTAVSNATTALGLAQAAVGLARDALTVATSPRNAQAAVVVGLEAQLGK